MSLGCPPAPVYKGARGEVRPARRRRARRSPTPTGSRTPSLPCWTRRGEGRREGERKGGRRPPSLSNSDLGRRGARLPLGRLSSSTNWAHEAQLTPRGVSVTPRYSGICPKLPETISVSEHSRPIYRSLRLDHFETPRHVPDLIRDSELLRYIKTHKLII